MRLFNAFFIAIFFHGMDDGRMDQWMDGLMDRPISYTDAIRASENDDFPTDFAIFLKASRTYGPTNRLINQQTDIPSYRDAIAASKNTRCLKLDDICLLSYSQSSASNKRNFYNI